MPFVPLAWLGEIVDVVPGSSAEDVAAALVRVGLEEEGVHGSGVSGSARRRPRAVSVERRPTANGKTIRYCRVDVGAELNDPARGWQRVPREPRHRLRSAQLRGGRPRGRRASRRRASRARSRSPLARPTGTSPTG